MKEAKSLCDPIDTKLKTRQNEAVLSEARTAAATVLGGGDGRSTRAEAAAHTGEY